MKDSVAKNECIGLADVLAMAYYGWCHIQRITPTDVCDDIVDLGSRIETYHREKEKKSKEKKR